MPELRWVSLRVEFDTEALPISAGFPAVCTARTISTILSSKTYRQHGVASKNSTFNPSTLVSRDAATRLLQLDSCISPSIAVGSRNYPSFSMQRKPLVGSKLKTDRQANILRALPPSMLETPPSQSQYLVTLSVCQCYRYLDVFLFVLQ